MRIDKSTDPAKNWCKELGFTVIDEYNDGKTYPDINGKFHNKKNLGCDFWIQEEDELFTVEAKKEFGGFSELRIHQVNRLQEGGILILVKENKDGSFSFNVKTYDDIKRIGNTMREIYWKR